MVLWILNLDVYIKCFDSLTRNDMNTIVAFISKTQDSTPSQALVPSRINQFFFQKEIQSIRTINYHSRVDFL
jgi:hypothetical protein